MHKYEHTNLPGQAAVTCGDDGRTFSASLNRVNVLFIRVNVPFSIEPSSAMGEAWMVGGGSQVEKQL